MATDKRIRYPARFFEDADGEVGVEFPDIGGAGMATHGSDPEDARRMARDLVNGYIIACFNEGDPLDSAPAALPKGTGWEWVLPSPAIEVATLIRHLREEKGLSQQEAARLIGVPYTSYQRWEHPKKCNATMRTLSRIAEAFGRRLEVVFR